PGKSCPAHAMGESRRTKAHLGQPQSVALLQKPVLFRYLKPIEFELADTAVLLGSHDRNAAHDAPAGIVTMVEEGGQTAARIIRCSRDQNEMFREGRTRDKPFSSVYGIFPAAPLCTRQHHPGGVRSGARMRLGHGKG